MKRKRLVRRVLGSMLILLVLAADFLAWTVYGSSLDKALIQVDPDETAYKQAEEQGLMIAEELENEGIVLLKNNGTLPLEERSSKINLLGYRAYNPVYGGTGSAGSSYLDNRISIAEALEQEGFEVNPKVWERYRNVVATDKNTFEVDFSIDEMAAEEALAEQLDQEYLFQDACSFEEMKEFSDTAVLVFGRAGGENNDLPTSMEEYSTYEPDKSKHYLELNAAEQSLLEQAGEVFDQVIVLINASNAMELGFLEREEVDAALWVGSPGDVGTKSIAGVLSGRVNPSGRTVDTYPYEVESIPSYYNFGAYAYTNTEGVFSRKKDVPQTAFLVEYQEGIYVGYRYFETREAFDYTTREGKAVKAADYEDVVQFPFGYGLSYTQFEWEVEEAEIPAEMKKDTEFRVAVKVTNTGEKAGKDVVELYYSAPYYCAENGSGIQKAEVELGDFQKTKLLAPGESQRLELQLSVQDMASYDEGYYTDSGAYVLEKGEYQISLRTDAHTVRSSFAYTSHLNQTLVYSEDGQENIDETAIMIGRREGDQVQAQNLFSDAAGNVSFMNRDSWEIIPGTEKEATEEQIQNFRNARMLPEPDAEEEAFPILETVTADHKVTFAEMKGKAYEDPLWEELLNQLSWKDMYLMIGANGWGSSAISSIEKPQIYDMDGPSAISYVLDTFMNRVTYRSVCYPSEAVMASGWNTELMLEFGRAISQEGKVFQVSGWYAPGVNIHRNPFAGRNFEYYSEDPVLSGKMACAVVEGCSENGMNCYIKHFALNEMETNRHYGICTWASEQSMREIYLKAFEIPVKSGKATAMMSSYNNLGTVWAGGCKALLTDLLRQEWGFQGIVLTDNFENQGFMDAECALAAGGTTFLYSLGVNKLERLQETASGQLLVREAVHRYLYTAVNSLASDVPYQIPLWRKILFPVSGVLLCLGIGIAAGLPPGKMKKRKQEE